MVLHEITEGSAPVSYRYDELGYVTDTVVLAVYGSVVEQETDPVGNIVRTKEYRRTSGTLLTPTEIETQIILDQKGRVRRIVDPEAGELGTVDATINYTFDAASGLYRTVATDRTGIETSEFTDAAGRLKKAVGQFGVETTYDYDLNGNLTKQTVTYAAADGRQPLVTMYAYDQLNRLRKTQVGETAPLVSYVDYFFPGETVNQWDVVLTDADGHATAKRFDSMQNPLVIALPDPGPDSSGTDVPNDAPVTVYGYEWNPAQLSSTVTTTLLPGSGSANIPLVVDSSSGQVRQSRVTIDSVGHRLKTEVMTGTLSQPAYQVRDRREYDAMGRVVRSFASGTDGSPTMYLYDTTRSGTGQVHMIVQPNGEVSAFEYDSSGNRMVQSDASDLNGPTTLRWFYDKLGRPITENMTLDTVAADGTPNGTVVASRVWTYTGLSTEYENKRGRSSLSRGDKQERLQGSKQ
ncbi:MAG: hypothetical protein R3C59_28380 [Planctomycetaceae bacterium]